ncbi:THAP domain-containing protein 1 isoform X2 [Halyomorpha halys]|uniref:THAP domain-containing protein 1 isoform X2 n=1 Tax=Halyomorpha halys TaxID=286706 RepID=UPI0034D2152F
MIQPPRPSIPVDPELRTQWIKAINRKNWTPAPNSRICSDHFVPSDFNMTYHSQIAHLREGVIPSIFPPLPKHLRIIPDETETPSEGSASSESSDDTELPVTSLGESTPSSEIPITSPENDAPRKKKMRTELHHKPSTHQREKRRNKNLLQVTNPLPGEILIKEEKEDYDEKNHLSDQVIIKQEREDYYDETSSMPGKIIIKQEKEDDYDDVKRCEIWIVENPSSENNYENGSAINDKIN